MLMEGADGADGADSFVPGPSGLAGSAGAPGQQGAQGIAGADGSDNSGFDLPPYSPPLGPAKGALSATTGTISWDATAKAIHTVVPTGAITLNVLPIPPVGYECYLIVVTSGVSSFVITFGTNMKSTGTLATGTTTAKTFVLKFVSDGTNLNEVSRTIAM